MSVLRFAFLISTTLPPPCLLLIISTSVWLTGLFFFGFFNIVLSFSFSLPSIRKCVVVTRPLHLFPLLDGILRLWELHKSSPLDLPLRREDGWPYYCTNLSLLSRIVIGTRDIRFDHLMMSVGYSITIFRFFPSASGLLCCHSHIWSFFYFICLWCCSPLRISLFCIGICPTGNKAVGL